MKSALILVCLAVSILFTQFASTSPLNAGDMKKILVLGDSLSGGFGLKPSEAYPALLANKLGLPAELSGKCQPNWRHQRWRPERLPGF